MTAKQLRALARAELERAREIERREADSEEPLSAEERDSHASAMQKANDYAAQADEIESRANASSELEQRIAEAEERASTPAGRVGAPLLDQSTRDGVPMPHTDPRNTRNGRHQFSFNRAVKAFCRGGVDALDGLEGETHAAMASAKRTAPQGLMLPLDAPLHRSLWTPQMLRALDTSTGSGSIQTTVVPTMIDYLRAQLVVARMGAWILPGVSGPFSLPKQTGTASGGWVTEGSDVPSGNATIGGVPFAPKTVGGLTSLTRKFMMQTNVDPEAFAQADIIKVLQYYLEVAALNGSGIAPVPKGILQYGSPVNSLAIATNGGPLTWALANQMVGKVNTSNAHSDRRGWIVNEVTASKLRATPKETGQAVYLLQDEKIGEAPVATTTLLPSNLNKGSTTGTCSAAIYGNFTDLVIPMFSAIDLLWDPYTQAASGSLRLAAMLDADINLRYPEAFCICTDIVTV